MAFARSPSLSSKACLACSRLLPVWPATSCTSSSDIFGPAAFLSGSRSDTFPPTI